MEAGGTYGHRAHHGAGGLEHPQASRGIHLDGIDVWRSVWERVDFEEAGAQGWVDVDLYGRFLSMLNSKKFQSKQPPPKKAPPERALANEMAQFATVLQPAGLPGQAVGCWPWISGHPFQLYGLHGSASSIFIYLPTTLDVKQPPPPPICH